MTEQENDLNTTKNPTTKNILILLLAGLIIIFYPTLLLLFVAQKIPNLQVKYVTFLLFILTIINGLMWLLSTLIFLFVFVAVWNYKEILLWYELLEPLFKDILNNILEGQYVKPYVNKINDILESYNVINRFNNVYNSNAVQIIEIYCEKLINGISNLFDKIILNVENKISKIIIKGKIDEKSEKSEKNEIININQVPNECSNSSDEPRIRKRWTPRAKKNINESNEHIEKTIDKEIENLNNVVKNISNSFIENEIDSEWSFS